MVGGWVLYLLARQDDTTCQVLSSCLVPCALCQALERCMLTLLQVSKRGAMTGGFHEGRVLRLEALRALKKVDAEVRHSCGGHGEKGG